MRNRFTKMNVAQGIVLSQVHAICDLKELSRLSSLINYRRRPSSFNFVVLICFVRIFFKDKYVKVGTQPDLTCSGDDAIFQNRRCIKNNRRVICRLII